MKRRFARRESRNNTSRRTQLDSSKTLNHDKSLSRMNKMTPQQKRLTARECPRTTQRSNRRNHAWTQVVLLLLKRLAKSSRLFLPRCLQPRQRLTLVLAEAALLDPFHVPPAPHRVARQPFQQHVGVPGQQDRAAHSRLGLGHRWGAVRRLRLHGGTVATALVAVGFWRRFGSEGGRGCARCQRSAVVRSQGGQVRVQGRIDVSQSRACPRGGRAV